MPFTPSLDICLETCNLIRFVDTTGVYSVGNTDGYGAGSGVLGSNIASAIITVTDEDGETMFSYTVTSEIPDTVTGDITFTSYEYALPDGEFTITYTLTHSNNTVYTYSRSYLNSCNFECCIDTLIATIPEKICANRCDTNYIDEVLTIEGLLYGYKCAAECEKETIKQEIQKRLERFCDLQCNCN